MDDIIDEFSPKILREEISLEMNETKEELTIGDREDNAIDWLDPSLTIEARSYSMATESLICVNEGNFKLLSRPTCDKKEQKIIGQSGSKTLPVNLISLSADDVFKPVCVHADADHMKTKLVKETFGKDPMSLNHTEKSIELPSLPNGDDIRTTSLPSVLLLTGSHNQRRFNCRQRISRTVLIM